MERSEVFLAFFVILTFLTLTQGQMRRAIIVHGGAGDIDEDMRDGKFSGMKTAIRVGFKILMEDDDPITAVEKAVNVLENLPEFNAGYGSVLTADGIVETDAVIINGTDLTAGSVAGVRNVANPVSLARLVLERTNHVLLVGEGAEEFAESQNVTYVPNECLIPPVKRKKDFGTVGAVAINSKGEIGVATSTGGMSGKMKGRVGDSPIIGAGSLADDNICGISGTGSGESFLRTTFASRVANLIESGIDAQTAADRALEFMKTRFPDADGGVIIITKDGDAAYRHNSKNLAWAWTNSEIDEIHFGATQNEDIEELFNLTAPVFPPPPSKSSSSRIINKIAIFTIIGVAAVTSVFLL